MEGVLETFQFSRKDRDRKGRHKLRQLFQLKIDLGFFPDVPVLSTRGLFFYKEERGKSKQKSKRHRDWKTEGQRWTVKLLGYGEKEQLQGGGARSDMTRAPTGLTSLLV